MLLTINLCRKPRGGVAMDIFLEEGIFEEGLEGWSRSLLGGEWGRWHPRQSKQYGPCYPIWHLCENDKKMLLPQDIWLPSARKYWYKSVMSTMSLWYPCAVPNLHSCTRQPYPVLCVSPLPLFVCVSAAHLEAKSWEETQSGKSLCQLTLPVWPWEVTSLSEMQFTHL